MTASSQKYFMKLLSKSFISQSTDFHFAKYRFSFRKVQIFILQSTDFQFAKYRFPFRKVQISFSQSTDPFRKVQISFSVVLYILVPTMLPQNN